MFLLIKFNNDSSKIEDLVVCVFGPVSTYTRGTFRIVIVTKVNKESPTILIRDIQHVVLNIPIYWSAKIAPKMGLRSKNTLNQ